MIKYNNAHRFTSKQRLQLTKVTWSAQQRAEWLEGKTQDNTDNKEDDCPF